MNFKVGDEVRHKLDTIWTGIGKVTKIQTATKITVLTVKFKNEEPCTMSTSYFTKVSKLEKALK